MSFFSNIRHYLQKWSVTSFAASDHEKKNCWWIRPNDFSKVKKILQGLRKNLLGRIGATFVTSLSAHQSRGRDFSPASAISRDKPCREGCEDNGPRWVCPKNEKTNGFVVLFVFLSWWVIERSVNIIIDRRRVAKNVDWLQIDREYLVDIGDK